MGFKEKVFLKEALKSWHKIPYGLHWTKRILRRAGTSNGVEADDLNIVLNRVLFLWNHQNPFLANLAKKTTNEKDISECIVVWCKTGDFHSYHSMAKMGHHGADMESSATLAGGIATQVIASSLVPFLIPVFVVYDVAVAVKSTRDTHLCQNEWSEISRDWNENFFLSITKR